VARAAVRVRGDAVAEIGAGYLILVGVGRTERQEDIEWLARKIAHLRVFEDAEGRMNRSLDEVSGEALVVPQFTLYPSWIHAAPPEDARAWVERFAQALEAEGVPVRRGAFQEHMEVELVNDGPVTLIFDRGGEGSDAAE
jgi:D-tyrosyl-tRNA(Tyr) deacylase